jgi:peptidoglycan/xylan/chitin deacetylase (PgdA/CDA1 family)
LGAPVSAAVVPHWHGRPVDEPAQACFQRWSAGFGEILLHGWTHCRERRPGLISWLTDRADEFNGLSHEEAADRIRRGVAGLEQIVQKPVRGFVPPAWQLPACVNWRACEIDYVVRFTRIERRLGPPLPLATWSWDWGRFGRLGTLGAWCGGRLAHALRRAIPVIVLHPADVRRGFVPAALSVIRRLRQQGRTPCLFRDIGPQAPAAVVS